MTHYTLLRAKTVTNVSRYSNTLLVSLNNRIYLRDRLPPGYRDDTRSALSDRVRTGTVATLSRFSGAEPRSGASLSDTYQLCDISRPLDLDKGHGDAASTDIPGTGNFLLPAAIRFRRF